LFVIFFCQHGVNQFLLGDAEFFHYFLHLWTYSPQTFKEQFPLIII
jgi:hypothetical protein